MPRSWLLQPVLENGSVYLVPAGRELQDCSLSSFSLVQLCTVILILGESVTNKGKRKETKSGPNLDQCQSPGHYLWDGCYATRHIATRRRRDMPVERPAWLASPFWFSLQTDQEEPWEPPPISSLSSQGNIQGWGGGRRGQTWCRVGWQQRKPPLSQEACTRDIAGRVQGCSPHLGKCLGKWHTLAGSGRHPLPSSQQTYTEKD